MIPDKIKIEILTPGKKVLTAEVDNVMLPGLKGYFGVFPGHTPFVAALKTGEIKLGSEKDGDLYAATGGIAEVQPGSISVLVETCENANKVDVKRAEAARDRAKNRLQEGRKSWDLVRAEASLVRAINRLKVASAG